MLHPQTFATNRVPCGRIGKKEDALKVGDAALAKGKAESANTAAFEKRVADMKAGKI